MKAHFNDPVDSADWNSIEAKTADLEKLIRRIAQDDAPAAFASSFGAEDMLLTDLIVGTGAPIEIFSIDTGRLPQETYALIANTRARYGAEIKIYFPRFDLVEAYVHEHGINAFYDSVDLRKTCCRIRKIEPLRRALSGKKAWITGLRAEQSAARSEFRIEEYDKDNGLKKFNPLLDWSEKEVWAYLRKKRVPYNALHDRFYPSIGCAPCTRSVAAGEDARSGRWWWENSTNRECGLHVRRLEPGDRAELLPSPKDSRAKTSL
ncbi:MAG: phosphoadenylyl-sulfate reductase [Candidatus Accumulibacter sp.]|jgi:phosphoadenosine phosphosulfate reductase|nr:phosphoadenylyl-sulfate reductase [Accumulibacter sp.]